MPRPSLKEERREQILDAFEACILRHGADGATLERVADEAGLARALIRHNVGNRDQLLAAFMDRFMEKSADQMREFEAALPSSRRLETLLEWLFDTTYSDSRALVVGSALINMSPDHPGVARHMRSWIESFQSFVEAELKAAYPGARADAIEIVAAGIMGIYFNVESLSLLGGLTSLRRQSLGAARRLVSTLQS